MNSTLPFRPIQNILICTRVSLEHSTAGLVLPVQEDTNLAQVLGAGRAARHSWRDGDEVIFNPTRVQEFVYEDTRYLALREEHAIARVRAGVMHPLNDYVIAKQLPTERVNKGGRVVIPAVADDREEAIVSDRGPDCAVLSPGDWVLYNKRMGDHFHFQDVAYVAFREEHVVCVVTRAEAAD
jgi:co-chaperonin GroES (HSP10)